MKKLIPHILGCLFFGYATNTLEAKDTFSLRHNKTAHHLEELNSHSLRFTQSKDLTYKMSPKYDFQKNQHENLIIKLSAFYDSNNPEPINGCGIIIPKSFEPNVEYGEILNIEATGIYTLDIKIFNQWGVKVLESEFVGQATVFDFGSSFTKKLRLVSKGEDDVSSNSKMTEGNYYYVLEICCQSGEKITKEGEIKLLRTQRK
jgi:hypothetical protein